MKNPQRQFLAGAACTLLLAACGGTAPVANTPTLDLKPCRVKGIDTEVKCATLAVYENRETKLGRKIALNIVVLPASARVKESDPIFLFAGGPGQAAASLTTQALALLGGLNNKRDLVLIDQRGTGKSNGLICKMPEPTDPGMGDKPFRQARNKQALIECRDVLSKDADLTQYTTAIAMADYDDVRVALGAEKINLWGGSYGTRSSMEYLRRYPQHVRSVVLDGVAPPSMALPIDFSRDAGAVYDTIFTACEKELACRNDFPNLKADVDALLTKLVNTPQTVVLADPVSGLAQPINVTRELVLMAVFQSLYVPELAAMMPSALTQARAGNFAPLMALGAVVSESLEQQMALGMQLSVVCTEDLPRIKSAQLEQSNQRTPFADIFTDEFSRACADWPRGKPGADYDQAVKSNQPVLILSGGLDPVTPPRYGEEVKKTLGNAAHLIAPNVGHGVSSKGCAPKVIKKFIETASIAGIDVDCLKKLPRPMFSQPLQEKKPKESHRVQTVDKASSANGEKK